MYHLTIRPLSMLVIAKLTARRMKNIRLNKEMIDVLQVGP